MKLMKGKISMISSLTYYHFPHEKIHRKEKRFLTEIYNWECLHLFFHLEVTRNTSQFINVILWVLSVSCNGNRLFIFSRVLKPNKIESTFQRGNLQIFSYIFFFNEHCLNPEVLINVEQFKKMCGPNILGYTIDKQVPVTISE